VAGREELAYTYRPMAVLTRWLRRGRVLWPRNPLTFGAYGVLGERRDGVDREPVPAPATILPLCGGHGDTLGKDTTISREVDNIISTSFTDRFSMYSEGLYLEGNSCGPM
jgi:hypothetical protein